MKLIWFTRGRTWGFRFLLDGGYSDPLLEFERVFFGVNDEDEDEVFHHVGDEIALRFLDPEGRKDASGRFIPHSFVIFAPWANKIGSFEEGKERVWALVGEDFRRDWNAASPQAASD